MGYYLLPLEKNEIGQIEDALKEINYDVVDRASVWSKKVIEKIINKTTGENAYKMIIEFLPDPDADKFTMLFKVKIE